MEYNKMEKSSTEVQKFGTIPDSKEEVEKLEAIDKDEILNEDLGIQGALILPPQTSQWKREWSVIQFERISTKTVHTFTTGGEAVLKALKENGDKGNFPFMARLVKKVGKNNNYYDLEVV